VAFELVAPLEVLEPPKVCLEYIVAHEFDKSCFLENSCCKQHIKALVEVAELASEGGGQHLMGDCLRHISDCEGPKHLLYCLYCIGILK